MEELIPELKRELAIAVVCDLMGKDKDEPNDYSGFYDPKLAFEYAMSGKDAFNAFFDVLKSVKTLEFDDGTFSAYLDKNVCMTENHPVCWGDLSTAESFVAETLFKHTRLLQLDCENLTPSDVEVFRLHIGQMQNLKELVVTEFDCLVDELGEWLVGNNVLKSVTLIDAPGKVFEGLNKFGTKFKLEEMVVTDPSDVDDLPIELAIPNLERVFKLSNFTPVELHLGGRYRARDICQVLKRVSNNSVLDNVKKLILEFAYNSLEVDDGGFQYDDVVLSTDELAELLPKRCPVLEEVVLDFEFTQFDLDTTSDLENYTKEIKIVVNSLEELIKKRRQNKLRLDVCANFDLCFNSFVDETVVLGFMKRQFPEFSFSDGDYDPVLKNQTYPPNNSVLGVEFDIVIID